MGTTTSKTGKTKKQALLDVLRTNGPFHLDEIPAILKEKGFRTTRNYVAVELSRLTKEGTVTRFGKGYYGVIKEKPKTIRRVAPKKVSASPPETKGVSPPAKEPARRGTFISDSIPESIPDIKDSTNELKDSIPDDIPDTSTATSIDRDSILREINGALDLLSVGELRAKLGGSRQQILEILSITARGVSEGDREVEAGLIIGYLIGTNRS